MCFWGLQYLLCEVLPFVWVLLIFRKALGRCGVLLGAILWVPLHAGPADWLISGAQFASYFTSCWGRLKWVLIKSGAWIASLHSALLIMNWSLWREVLVNTLGFRKFLLALDSFMLLAWRIWIWKWCGFGMTFVSTIATFLRVVGSSAFGSREIHNIQQALARNT